MAVYKVRLNTGEVITIEDGRDIATLSKTLCEKGHLQAHRRDSAYASAKMTMISVMERAVSLIEVSE